MRQTEENETFKHFITQLSTNDHSTWKATTKFERPIVPVPPLRKPDRSWACSTSEKSVLFAENHASAFTPNSDNNDDAMEAYLTAPCQLSPPVRAFTPAEVTNAINLLNPH
jgi:hypothetical protein